MKNKAFTILEILVVISVIAVLVGISIPKFKGMQNEAKIAKAKAELKTLQAAVESYKNNNANTLPANLDALVSATPKIISSTLSDTFEAAGTWYGYDVDGAYYVLYSTGLDGTAATSINASGQVTTSGDDIYRTNGTRQ